MICLRPLGLTSLRHFLSVLLVVLATGCAPLSASADDVDSQLWLQFVFNARLKNGLRFFAEVQPRWGEGYSRISQLFLRPGVGYQVKPNLSVWLGYAWSPSFIPEFNTEYHYFQQLLLEDHYRGFDMTNRTRLEERNIAGAGATSLRLRHLLRFSKPLDTQKHWAAVVSDELFWNLNSTPNGPEDGFDQNRVSFGFTYNATRHTRVELGYTASFINPPRGRPDRRLDILALTFSYTL